MNDEIKFDLDKDIIMQIEMASYAEYNDTLAMMNDHLGEIYGYSDLKDVEEAQLHYEKELAYKAIKELQQENERLKERVAYLERSNNRREDTIIGLRFEVAEQEDYKSRCEKASEKLGNYKHYSTPTEEQNSENEDIVDSALNILQNGSDKSE